MHSVGQHIDRWGVVVAQLAEWLLLIPCPLFVSSHRQNYITNTSTVNFGKEAGWGAAIAQWIRLRLPSCHPGF